MQRDHIKTINFRAAEWNNTRLGSIVSAWLYQQEGGAKEEEISLHATVFGQLSNQRCVWFDDFSLTESHLPTVMSRESALEAYRSPGGDCLHRRLEAWLLLGVKCLCVCVFCMNANVLVNAHPSVSLCMTHVGMWNTVNFCLCVWVLESSGLLSLSLFRATAAQMFNPPGARTPQPCSDFPWNLLAQDESEYEG